MKTQGRIEAFDAATGLGTVTAADGATYPFHSTVIADGTRNIAVGAEVTFEIVPGNLGRWEAAAVSAA